MEDLKKLVMLTTKEEKRISDLVRWFKRKDLMVKEEYEELITLLIKKGAI